MAAELPSLPAKITGAASDAGQGCIAAVMVHQVIVAEGRAASGKNAKVKASAAALHLLHGLAPFEFRAKYGCDCVPSPPSEDQKVEGEK
jgi:endoribonuclease Dicer